MGSSPRVRGTDLHPRLKYLHGGIIPACAGNSSLKLRTAHLVADHPRVCGEQLKATFIPPFCEGSSPRVRGTDRSIHGHVSQSGIIPACAGNRHILRHLSRCAWDHPRVCGEQPTIESTICFAKGSSPRVRGTATYVRSRTATSGIIPACAGNRFVSKVSVSGKRDHPRVCGEQTKDPQLNITHPS